MASFRRKLRHFRKGLVHALLILPEIVVVRLGVWIIPRLSRRKILRLAHLLGGCAFRLSKRNNRHMRANLKLIYGDSQSEEERRRFMRAVWNHAALVLLDCVWFLRNTSDRIKEHVEFDPSFRVLSDNKEGAVAVTAHVGNWEVAAHSVCQVGRELSSVFAPIGATRLTQQTLLSSRESNGQHLVARQGAVLHLLRALRNGQIIGLLLDQFNKVSQGGMFVNILGMPAPISKIAGVLHHRRKCPVHILACIHTGTGHYRVFLFDTLPVSADLSEENATRWVANALSRLIRSYPEQWLWMYRRWRHIFPGDNPARYPDYAHFFNPLID